MVRDVIVTGVSFLEEAPVGEGGGIGKLYHTSARGCSCASQPTVRLGKERADPRWYPPLPGNASLRQAAGVHADKRPSKTQWVPGTPSFGRKETLSPILSEGRCTSLAGMFIAPHNGTLFLS